MRLNDEGFAGCLQQPSKVYAVEINFVGKVAVGARNTVRISKIPNESGPKDPPRVGLATFEKGAANFAAVVGLSRAVAKTWFRVSNEPWIPYKVSFHLPFQLTTVCNYLHL